MTLFAKGRVRLAPAVCALLLACGEAPLEPEVAPSFAAAGSGATSTAIEPDRIQQIRWYESESLARQCQLNSFEDLDGNDFVRYDRTGTSFQTRIAERDAFVLIREAPAATLDDVPGHRSIINPDGSLSTDWVVTGVGRASWKSVVWQGLDAEGAAFTISVNSQAQGVVAPLNGPSAVSQAVAIRSAVAANSPESLKLKLADDLANAALGPGDAVVDLINAALREAEGAGTLRGVDCEWEQGIKPFVFNEVRYQGHWPRELRTLFR